VNLTIDAPCKVNLNLNIGGRRQDGFHDVESIFAAFTLCDTLKFEAGEASGGSYQDEVQLDTAELPHFFGEILSPPRLSPEKNLVYRAIKLFKSKTGFDRTVKVNIVKRIPPAAGLGGGSSDAAAALLAMNTISGAALTNEELLRCAAELGSDIPFFIELAARHCPESNFCYAAYVSGRGERVEFSAAPPLDIVIANPCIESGTKEAFALLDETRASEKKLSLDSVDMRVKNCSKTNALAELSKDPSKWRFANDFLTVFMAQPSQKKKYQAILQDLARQGSLFSGLSGSGSSCFGIFPNSAAAKTAAHNLSAAWPFVRAARSLNAGRCF
jgi:4-diphosphocytidyl-2-C-methyl-D-erythritol kinase